MLELYNGDFVQSGSGDLNLENDVHVKGCLINSGSGDLKLKSGIIERDVILSGSGDISSIGTVIVGGNLSMHGNGDINGKFIILGKLINSGSGDVAGKISATGYNFSGSGDIYAKKTPFSPASLQKYQVLLDDLSNVDTEEYEKIIPNIEASLDQPYDSLLKDGITVNIHRGDIINEGGLKTGDIMNEGSNQENFANSKNRELRALDIASKLKDLRKQCETDEIFNINLTLEILKRKIKKGDSVKHIESMIDHLGREYAPFSKPNDEIKKQILGLCTLIEELYYEGVLSRNDKDDGVGSENMNVKVSGKDNMVAVGGSSISNQRDNKK